MATEYISKEAALACFHDWMDRYGHEHTADEIVEYQRIEDLPVADVVEVVRCGDCAEWDRSWTPTWDQTGDAHYCGMVDGVTKSSFFCAHGERRTENAE